MLGHPCHPYILRHYHALVILIICNPFEFDPEGEVKLKRVVVRKGVELSPLGESPYVTPLNSLH